MVYDNDNVNFFTLASLIKLDIGLVLGASGSNADQVFDIQKRFVVKSLDNLMISDSGVLLGAVTYGDKASIAFNIGEGKTKEATRDLISKVVNPADGSNVANALNIVRTQLFDVAKGARRDTPKTIWMFVDKTISSGSVELQKEILELRKQGIKLLVIGIGNEIDKVELSNLVMQIEHLWLWSGTDVNEILLIINSVIEKSLPGRHDPSN